MRIERARFTDAVAIAAIYAHHVVHGTATWELDPPSPAEMSARIARTLDSGWPWLVARSEAGEVLGYAYASQLNPRPGYLHACENSIYVDHRRMGEGLGKALLTALIEASERAGFRQMVALIAGTEPASIALHTRAGFVHCGGLKSVGRKHGRWLDLIYMQRALGQGDSAPPEREPTSEP